ncbi:MAG: PrpR N-terminal domain-containing protein [Lachnospiraceae bacterium]|nr:PrpR N-terminal domain-containing protein [Lachnospiraceae bacterium]
MGKIALLVPREEMVYQAHNILQEKSYQDKHYQVVSMKVVRTKHVVMEARQSIADGAAIIIARGLQASLIKQYTDIPVIEIVITAQEMALLVMKAKQILKKERPVIAVVGFRNMFCDMSYFDSIYGIELRTFYAPNNELLRSTAIQAVEEKVDLIIGGDVAVETAAAAGIPSLFLSTTEDSLRNAFSMAESISFAMDVEKKNAAQMETLLDHSFGGVVNVDSEGRVTAVNPLMEDMLGMSRKKIVGRLLTELFPDLDPSQVERVLEKGGDGYSTFLQARATSVFAILAPVQLEGRVDGAILTCHKMKRKLTAEQESQSRRHSNGLIALGRFSDILQESPAMQDCIHKAKLYALSDLPVLIEGEAGTEKRLMAQSIHNASLRSRNAFADVSCTGLTDQEQFTLLFDEKGAAVQADGGTLLLEDGDALSSGNQYRLLQLLRYRIRWGRELQQNKHLDVRVMMTASHPGAIEAAVAEGRFREDLYYLIQGLKVQIPPMRQRREDLQRKLEISVRESCERYDRYHVLTHGAAAYLLEYPWPGNLFQIENFCERLILTAAKRSLDEWAVKEVLDELFGALDGREKGAGCQAPVKQAGARGRLPDAYERNLPAAAHAGHTAVPEQNQEEVWPDERSRQVYETLKKYGGSRMKAAAELGISKATLWRWMKKYGLQ